MGIRLRQPSEMMKIVLTLGLLLAVCNGLPRGLPQSCFPFCGTTNTQNCQGSQCNINNGGGGGNNNNGGGGLPRFGGFGGFGGVSNTQNCLGSQCGINNGFGPASNGPVDNTQNCRGSQCNINNGR